jgi:hypothetical protein
MALLLFATGALEQGNKCADVAVVAGGAKHRSSDTAIRYSLAGNIAKKLTQAKHFSNSPSGTTFWAKRVAEDRFGRYVLALSVAGGSNSGK